MKLRKTGLIFGGVYIGICFIFIVWGMFTTDPKSKFVILQLPVVLQHGVLLYLEFTNLLAGMSWFKIYLLLATPVVILLYFIGFLIEVYSFKLISKFAHDQKTK